MSFLREIIGGITDALERGRSLRRDLERLAAQNAELAVQVSRLAGGSALVPGLTVDPPITRLRVSAFVDDHWLAQSMYIAPPEEAELFGRWVGDGDDLPHYRVEPEPWAGNLFVGCRCLGIQAYVLDENEPPLAVYRIIAGESMGMYGVITGAPESGLYPWVQIGVNPAQAHGGLALPTAAAAYDPEIGDRATIPVDTVVHVYWTGSAWRIGAAEEALSEPCVEESE